MKLVTSLGDFLFDWEVRAREALEGICSEQVQLVPMRSKIFDNRQHQFEEIRFGDKGELKWSRWHDCLGSARWSDSPCPLPAFIGCSCCTPINGQSQLDRCQEVLYVQIPVDCFY